MEATKAAPGVWIQWMNNYSCQAIETKFLGPTDTKGSRCKAVAEGGATVTVGWLSELGSLANHRRAAEKLCAKMGWSGKLATGTIKGGAYVHIFTE